ncbi:hypothetical protein [Helicobacter cappadocius]|uniref:Uncharacterized protein n=1 Tax=Helicobacter cappadocius TaxID=3063998 RepID=A0AA90PM99_9HELI|nr:MULTISPECIES: hypothetical protein [unclassified Helicobacter]MDO7253893.1 hypothetical protein [Helicobacter sp. faydin-H75]MDP2539754.1 hypothetical protein [Helicobacter sp. faydin-H76]
MRWICILLTLLCFSGCIEYQKVLVPTSCDVPKRDKPSQSGDLLKDLRAILIYSEFIEQDLEFCRGRKPP